MDQAELVNKGKECIGDLLQKVDSNPRPACIISLVTGAIIGIWPTLFLVLLLVVLVAAVITLFLSSDENKDDSKDNKDKTDGKI